ncbi:rho GTPase-activating protein Graf [Pectinophora gossypiella]|nr:rho GTPase-activating protein Graf [Pectinophora gossypiella]
MGVGLQPLEFTECLADSPAFRENLQRHEKELERTSQQIKRLIKEVKDVVQAAKRLGDAQKALATSMEQFEFACIGASQTEDERVIGRSLHHFAHLIRTIEEERERMLGRAHEQIIQPLEKFRKEHIGAVKEGKKKFDKKTAKFCQSQERTLSLSVRKPETVFQEADAALDMAERDFCQASLEYVFQLQAVQERKKFELVETLLGFVFGWWTFHHTAHDVHADAEPRVRDLQLRIQRTRSNFEETSKQTESLMKKMMEVRQQSKEGEASDEAGGRSGYLFLQEKKAFGTTWSKQYAVYSRGSRLLQLQPYSQLCVKAAAAPDAVPLAGARPPPEPIERRFCWEALPADRERPPLLLQAASERERAAWLRAVQRAPGPPAPAAAPAPAPAYPAPPADPPAALDAAGFSFVRRIIQELEARGLEEQGLYRVAGVASKTARLVAAAADGRVPATLSSPHEWESRTLTSALKAYLRALPDRLLSQRLHKPLIQAAKLERRSERVSALHALVRALPPEHLDMLRLVLAHLRNVAARSDRNLMTHSNLAVCFGPTLLHADTDSVASILELKFCNVLVETLLDHYQDIFEAPAPPPVAAPPPQQPQQSQPPQPPPHNGMIRTSPTALPLPSRTDLTNIAVARYPAAHQQLLAALPPGSSSSSADSVSSCELPPLLLARPAGPGPRAARVRTLYACLGESEGELSFEPNQILTNVTPSPEPGWLRGTLNGRTGLVPENYVEPLP